MVGSNEQPTNSISQHLLADGGVALKIGNGYLTIDSNQILRVSATVPASVSAGDVVGDQTAGE